MEHDQRQELINAKAMIATTNVTNGTANTGVNAATGAVETDTANIALTTRMLRFMDDKGVGTFEPEPGQLRAAFVMS